MVDLMIATVQQEKRILLGGDKNLLGVFSLKMT